MSGLAQVCGYALTIIAFATFLYKLWKKIKNIATGQTCMMRSDITDTYYRHSGEAEPTLREYERKNLDDLYDGYKALGGNHYIDDIYKEMREWKVVT